MQLFNLIIFLNFFEENLKIQFLLSIRKSLVFSYDQKHFILFYLLYSKKRVGSFVILLSYI